MSWNIEKRHYSDRQATAIFVGCLFVCCGQYSPTWIFDFEKGGTGVDDDCVLRIFFFLFTFFKIWLLSKYNHRSTNKTFKAVFSNTTLFFVLFIFDVSCGLYSPTWIFDFEKSCVGVEVIIVCSVFFSLLYKLQFLYFFASKC